MLRYNVTQIILIYYYLLVCFDIQKHNQYTRILDAL
jgi:hypothetical protein